MCSLKDQIRLTVEYMNQMTPDSAPDHVEPQVRKAYLQACEKYDNMEDVEIEMYLLLKDTWQ